MKLADIAQSSHVKALVYGPSSTGKTCFAAGFPTPIRYLDFDNKVSSAAQFYIGQERLNEIDVTQYAQIPRETRMMQFLADVQSLFQLANSGKALGYKTIVLDSLTTLVQYMLEDYLNVSRKEIKRPGPDMTCMQDYGLLDTHTSQLMKSILALEANIVVIGHAVQDKDEVSGIITNQVLMPGKGAAKLPIYFEEVYFSKVDASGKFLLQTQSDSKTVCRTQRKLPKEIRSAYSEIVK